MTASFMQTVTLDAADAASWPDAMARLRAKDLGAIILRGVYDPSDLSKLPDLLAANSAGLIKTEFPPAFCAYFYGINLNLAHPDLTRYFAAEPDFRARLATLPFGDTPFEPRICDILSRLDDGRKYSAAPGPDGNRHFFTTLRAHLTNGYIPAHFDNESALRPSYAHIAARCEPDIYSFVLCIDQAEAGGALQVYNLTSATEAAAFRNYDSGLPKRDLSEVEKVDIRLNSGEMVILHSSHYLHGVSRVQGDRTRWTACSFMALSRDGSEAFCWG